MKVVVIGGSGLIGKKLVPLLRQLGHEAVPASPSTGVNALTGEGLADALTGADVVVDVSNSPSWADAEVLAFFDASTRNLLAAEQAAGVRHHVALSVVGADRMPDSGYMRAKVNQEQVIEAGGVPYTIVRATQFFEFLGWLAGKDDPVRLPSAPMQPLATLYLGVRDYARIEVTNETISELAFLSLKAKPALSAEAAQLEPAEQMAASLLSEPKLTGEIARAVPLAPKALRALVFAFAQLDLVETVTPAK